MVKGDWATHFGGARLPKGPMILTKLLACLNPASGYINMLAEPRHIVWYGEARCAGRAGFSICLF